MNPASPYMKVFEVGGAKVMVQGPCACGSVCTEGDAKREVASWNMSAQACSFCGKPILITAVIMDHHHLCGPKDWSPIKRHPHLLEDSRWASSGWATYEPNFSWFANAEWGVAKIDAHVSCARAGMPYGNFKETVYGHPEGIPAEFGLPEADLDPCGMCGAVPTQGDLARVAARIYSFLAPCVYCGKPLKLHSVKLTHGSFRGKHHGHWHFDTFKREEAIQWCGQSQTDSGFISLEFTGHLSCAEKAMPYMHLRRK